MASASHGAAPSAVGYQHQTWWALVELLQSGAGRPDAAITLELHDDVAWEQGGTPTQQLQVAVVGRPGPGDAAGPSPQP